MAGNYLAQVSWIDPLRKSGAGEHIQKSVDPVAKAAQTTVIPAAQTTVGKAIGDQADATLDDLKKSAGDFIGIDLPKWQERYTGARDFLDKGKKLFMGSGASKYLDAEMLREKYTTISNAIPERIIFPTELATLERPIFELRCMEAHSVIREGTTVYLPAPEGLAYSNKATYNDSEIGIIGSKLLAGSAGVFQSDTAGSFASKIEGEFAKAKGEYESLAKNPASTVKAAVLFGAKKLESLDKGSASAISIGARAVFNPFIVTSFDGTGTRSYEFEYEFIPSSPAEAETIKHMARLFQIAVYGQTEAVVLLKYPPRWQLTILGQTRGDNKLSPLSAFYDCYLESCDVTYNESNNSFFQDNSPLSTKISLGFKETKALHADEIAGLLIS